MSEISSKQREQREVLAELQADYSQKRKKVVKESEEEIADLKDNYRSRKESVANSGEAAINHIRERQSDDLARVSEHRQRATEIAHKQLAALEENYKRKIEATQEAHQQSLERLKRQAQKEKSVSGNGDSLRAMAAERADHEEALTNLADEYREKRRKVIRENERNLKQIALDHKERIENIETRGQESLKHIQEKQMEEVAAAEKLRALNHDRVNKEIVEMETNLHDKMAKIREAQDKVVTKLNDDTNRKVTEMESKSAREVEQTRFRTDRDVKLAKERYLQTTNEMTEKSKQRLEELQAQNDMKQRRELEKGQLELEKIKTKNEKTLNNSENDGQNKIAKEKERNANVAQKLEKEYQKQLEKQKAYWIEREKELNTEYANKLTELKEAQSNDIKTRNRRFTSEYEKVQKGQKNILEEQNRTFQNVLNSKKKDFLVEAQRYEGRDEDPFYKVQDRGTRMSETPSSYVIEAYVPEHEKDIVKVIVEKDGVTVQGQRAFKDKFEEEGKKVSTNSYQSFREEFPFDKPVATQGMTRERNGDWMVITVPKILNISRKA